MTLHLRQVCLVTDQIQTATRDLTNVFSLKPCFIDDGVAKFGLQNVLMPVGRDFLEIVAPTQPDTYAERYMRRRGGDGGYMVICQVRTKAEQDAHRQRAVDAGVRVAWENDGPTWRYVQYHPGDMMGAFLTVDYDSAERFNGTWTPAGGDGWQDKVSTGVVERMTAVELQGPEPEAMANHWSKVTGIAVTRREGSPCLPLANADLLFVPDDDGRGPGLGGIHLSVADPDRLRVQARENGVESSGDELIICGTRFKISQRSEGPEAT